MPAGRHTKRTPETEAKLFQALALGATRKAACEYVGVHPATLCEWCVDFPEFAEAVTQAEAKAELTCAAAIVNAASQGDWRAADTWLRKRRREEWGDETRLTGPDGGAIQVTYVNSWRDRATTIVEQIEELAEPDHRASLPAPGAADRPHDGEAP